MFTHPAITAALVGRHRRDLITQADNYRLARAANKARRLRQEQRRCSVGGRPATVLARCLYAVLPPGPSPAHRRRPDHHPPPTSTIPPPRSERISAMFQPIRIIARSLLVPTLAVLAGSALAAAPSQIAQAAGPSVKTPLLTPNPSATTNVLASVSATSASNAWAVGYYHNNSTGDTDTLILRWNGTAWKQVATPNPGPVWNFLYGVSATSASNAWAVGYYVNKAGTAEDTLALHWNGTAWKQVATPNPSSSSNHLNGVWATSTGDAWAVGQYTNNTTGEKDTLVLRWNGTAWTQIASPNPSPGTQDPNTLNGVAGTSASDIWAAGFYVTSTNTTQTLILHWNGTAWNQVPSPNPARLTNTLYGVAATSASDAWAVGQYTNNTTGVDDTLILHWNGTAWNQVPSPNAGSLGNLLSGVSATSASDAWAAGDSCTNVACTSSNTLILHWNGTAWNQVPSPNAGSVANVLSAVSATSASNADAVGYYDITTLGPRDTLALRWNGTSWTKT